MWEQMKEALAQSASRVIARVADFLPGVLALIVAVLLASVIGALVRWMVRRFLVGIRFDERLDRWGFSGLSAWSPERSPTMLAARVAFWAVLLLGLLIGVSALHPSIASIMAVRLFDYFPNVVVAVLLMLAGSFLARFLARGVLISAVNARIQSARLISLGVKWLVLILSATMALSHLSIGGDILKLAFAIFFGGIVFAMALAVGLGSKDLVSKSLEQRSGKESSEAEEPFHHL